jgi:hypothetical protein
MASQVVCSYLFFPKALRWAHIVGGLLILASLPSFKGKKVGVKAKASPRIADDPLEETSDYKIPAVNEQDTIYDDVDAERTRSDELYLLP